MNDHYQELARPLIPLDPLLVFSVGYVCPKSDTSLEICPYTHDVYIQFYAIALLCGKTNLILIRFLSSHGSNPEKG